MMNLLSPDKRGLATMIVAHLHNPEGEGEVDPKLEAAKELIDAVHSKNEKGVVDALESLWELCEQDEPEGEESGHDIGI